MSKNSTSATAYHNQAFEVDPGFTAISIDGQSNKNIITYSWDKVNVFAIQKPATCSRSSKVAGEEIHILKEAYGICHPGELVAIMGASGAGKTTLLNVLTSRSGKNLRIEGNLYVNGESMSREEFTSKSAYVQQEDLFIGTMTVKEQLVFQAMLRMDRHIPRDKRMERVEQVMIEMGLVKCKDTLIGIPGRIKGISGGETKRLAFACEVLTDPPLMFCDEPTTGIDSFMAQTIVSAMKDMAAKGKTIISTIHQPSSEVFAMFNRVLLLAEGRLAFLGTTKHALEFFKSQHRICPKNFNPADFFISTLAIVPNQEAECKDFVESLCIAFDNSKRGQKLKKSVQDNINRHVTNKADDNQLNIFETKPSPYKASGLVQFGAVMHRCMLEMIREPLLLRIKIIQTIMIAVLIGLIYLDTSGSDHYNNASVTNINGALFLLSTNLSFQFCFGVVNTFCTQLPIFLREHFNGMYSTHAFFISKNLAEVPVAILLPALFIGIVYYMINLYEPATNFFICIGILILVSNVAVSFGYLISCVANDLQMALAIAAPMLIPFMLFGGFFLNSDTVPAYFIWLKYISWFNFANEALIINQWADIKNITCEIESNSLCFSNGHEIISQLGYDEDHMWLDVGCLFALLFFFRIFAYLALLRKTYVRD